MNKKNYTENQEDIENLLEDLLQPINSFEFEEKIDNIKNILEQIRYMDTDLGSSLLNDISGDLSEVDDYVSISDKPFSDIDTTLKDAQEYLENATEEFYSHLGQEWVEKFDNAKRSSSALNFSLEKWLNKDWLKQGLLLNQTNELLDIIFYQKSWQEYLPKLFDIHRDLMKSYKDLEIRYSPLTPFNLMSYWENNIKRLSLEENKDCLESIIKFTNNYIKSIGNHPIFKNIGPKLSEDGQNTFRSYLSYYGLKIASQLHDKKDFKNLALIINSFNLKPIQINWNIGVDKWLDLLSDKKIDNFALFLNVINKDDFFSETNKENKLLNDSAKSYLSVYFKEGLEPKTYEYVLKHKNPLLIWESLTKDFGGEKENNNKYVTWKITKDLIKSDFKYHKKNNKKIEEKLNKLTLLVNLDKNHLNKNTHKIKRKM